MMVSLSRRPSSEDLRRVGKQSESQATLAAFQTASYGALKRRFVPVPSTAQEAETDIVPKAKIPASQNKRFLVLLLPQLKNPSPDQKLFALLTSPLLNSSI
jgi:hypothetical protein